MAIHATFHIILWGIIGFTVVLCVTGVSASVSMHSSLRVGRAPGSMPTGSAPPTHERAASPLCFPCARSTKPTTPTAEATKPFASRFRPDFLSRCQPVTPPNATLTLNMPVQCADGQHKVKSLDDGRYMAVCLCVCVCVCVCV
jgi:hypothetical protein